MKKLFYLFSGVLFSFFILGVSSILKSNDYSLNKIYHYQMKPVYSKEDYVKRPSKKNIRRYRSAKVSAHKKAKSLKKAHSKYRLPLSRTYSKRISHHQRNHKSFSSIKPLNNRSMNGLKKPFLGRKPHELANNSKIKVKRSLFYKPVQKQPLVIIPNNAQRKLRTKVTRYRIARWQGITTNGSKGSVYVARLKGNGPVLFREK